MDHGARDMTGGVSCLPSTTIIVVDRFDVFPAEGGRLGRGDSGVDPHVPSRFQVGLHRGPTSTKTLIPIWSETAGCFWFSARNSAPRM